MVIAAALLCYSYNGNAQVNKIESDCNQALEEGDSTTLFHINSV